MNKEIWRKNIKTLKAHHKRYGDSTIPLGGEKDKVFAKWVENVRRHASRLTDQERRELTEAGFNFNPGQDWNTMFRSLEQFYKKHGHTSIPSDQQALEKLFDWTLAQKRSRTLLTPAQIKNLDSLDFDWEVSTDNDVKWMAMYQKLGEFKREHGHVKVPQDFKEDLELGRWVSRQRRRETQGELSKNKKQLLSSLGFLWKEDIARMREQSWENRYRELALFKRTHGHIDRLQVRRQHYQLGLWMETQMLSQHRMSRTRKEKLNAIGFQWDKGDFYEERWNEMFQRLIAYRKKHGHCQVKRSEDFKLSVWLQKQNESSAGRKAGKARLRMER